MKEHCDACQKGTLEMSALAECAWESHHLIKWEETTVVDQPRTPQGAVAEGDNPHLVAQLLPPPPPPTGMDGWSCLDG